MATAQTSAPPTVRSGVQPLRAGEGYSFLLRKLHSLLGIIPIGAFLLEHLLSNFEALKGPIAYGEQVRFLNSLPLVRVLEWVFIFLPILYHGCYGVWIWLRGKSNIVYYPWAGNWLYVSQRYTGLIAFAYIAQHVIRQRFMGVSLPEHPMAAFAKVQQELANPWLLAVYIIAMIAICWHFAYGVWLFAAKWGITPGATARKRFGFVCVALGLGLAVMGLMSIWAFVGGKYAGVQDRESMTAIPSNAVPGSLASQIIPEATLEVGAMESRSLPAPQGSPVLFAANEHLDIDNGGVRRTILEYPRTLGLGWAPDGQHFFVNDEEASNVTELYVFNRTGRSHEILDKRILRAIPHLQELARRGSHMYISAKKWIDARTLEVEVSGHSDEAPVEEFDTRLRVTLEGVVTRL
jgi:succinate dehydrogenase / fumarate reductase cytochrome b subunit